MPNPEQFISKFQFPRGEKAMDFELTEEQKMLKKMAGNLAKKEFKPRAFEWDEKEEFPWDNVRKLAAQGLLGITIPEEYGGSGKTIFEWALVIEEIAKYCSTSAIIILGHAGEPCQIITRFGGKELKEKCLPAMAKGEKMAANALTEPNAGSSLTDLLTNAALDGDDYVINGTKCFTSRGNVSDFFLTFVRFNRIPGAKGIGAVIVEKGTPGFVVGKVEKKMGFRGIPSTDLIFENCRIPRENVLLKEGGFKHLMIFFDAQRCGNAALCLGIAQGALDMAIQYSQERKQFGRELWEFQGIQWTIADMAIRVEAARGLVYKAAYTAAKSIPSVLESSIAKAFSSEIAFEVTNKALQIHGGYGYSREFPLERMVRDVRGLSIGGGTTEMLKIAIASDLLKRRISQRKEQ